MESWSCCGNLIITGKCPRFYPKAANDPISLYRSNNAEFLRFTSVSHSQNLNNYSQSNRLCFTRRAEQLFMRVKSKSSKANKFCCFLIRRCLRVRLSWLIFICDFFFSHAFSILHRQGFTVERIWNHNFVTETDYKCYKLMKLKELAYITRYSVRIKTMTRKQSQRGKHAEW